MQIGDVRVAEEADFDRLRNLCQCHDDWRQDYNKNGTTVWTKTNDVSNFQMVKVGRRISTTAFYFVLTRKTDEIAL